MSEIASKLKNVIEQGKHVIFFGGAGVSTASDIPDFRGKNGIYNTHNKWNIPPEAIISHTFYTLRTADFFEYYKENMLYPDAKPNACHKTLAELEKIGRIKAVITQNIDGLHQKAGSKRVFELHGSVHRNFCTKCGKFYDLDYIISNDGVPKCSCGGVVKPDVVLYEEGLNDDVWNGAVREILNADTLIVGGSSLTVNPAAYLVDMFNGKLVIVNNQPTPYDYKANLIIRENINEIFENLLEEYEKE